MEKNLSGREANEAAEKRKADTATCTQLETMTRSLSSDANAYDRHKAEEAAIRLGKKYAVGFQPEGREKRSITGLLRMKVRDGLALYRQSFPKPINNYQGSGERSEKATEVVSVGRNGVEQEFCGVEEEVVEEEESLLG